MKRAWLKALKCIRVWSSPKGIYKYYSLYINMYIFTSPEIFVRCESSRKGSNNSFQILKVPMVVHAVLCKLLFFRPWMVDCLVFLGVWKIHQQAYVPCFSNLPPANITSDVKLNPLNWTGYSAVSEGQQNTRQTFFGTSIFFFRREKFDSKV